MCPEAAGCRGQGPARGQRRGSATRAQPDRARLGRLLPQRGVHQTFHKLDGYGWTLLYRWALFRHPDKPKRWVIDRYFGQFHPTRHDRWVFGNRDSGAYLHRFAWTPIVRHDLVKGAASPDDPALATYWAQRRRKAVPPPINLTVLRLLSKQRGRCPVCGGLLLHADHQPQSPTNGSSGCGPPARRSPNRRSSTPGRTHRTTRRNNVSSTRAATGGHTTASSLPALLRAREPLGLA